MTKRRAFQFLTEPPIRRNKRERMAKQPVIAPRPKQFLFTGRDGHTMTFDDMSQAREWLKGKVRQ